MKKSKSSERAREFKNKPFKSLTGYKPSEDTPRVTEKKKDSPILPEKDEDAREMFLHAVSGAKVINPGVEQHALFKETKKVVQQNAAENKEQDLFLQAMQKITPRFTDVSSEPEEEDIGSSRSSSSRMKQLKRGTIKIREQLDLHGHIKAEALVTLERFVSSAYNRGLQAVLVITGKGINSPDGPVLHGAVASWLQEKGRDWVAEFALAPRNYGGSGAYVVFLKIK